MRWVGAYSPKYPYTLMGDGNAISHFAKFSQTHGPMHPIFCLIYLEKINFQNVLALKLYLEKYFFLFNSYYRLVHKTAVFGHHKGVMRLSSLVTMRLAPQARHYMSCLAKHGGVT